MMETATEKMLEFAKRKWNSSVKTFCIHEAARALGKTLKDTGALLSIMTERGYLKRLPYATKCEVSKRDHSLYQLNPEAKLKKVKKRRKKQVAQSKQENPAKRKRTTLEFEFEDFRVKITRE